MSATIVASTGCVPVEDIEESEPLGLASLAASSAEPTEIPVPTGYMNAEDLPGAAKFGLSFTSSANVYNQLQALPPKKRACVAKSLSELGLGDFLDPESPAGRVPTFSESPVTLTAVCAGVTMTVSFVTTSGGADSEGHIQACTSVIWEWLDWFAMVGHDLFSCYELICASNFGGVEIGCGCPESIVSDCSNCPDGGAQTTEEYFGRLDG